METADSTGLAKPVQERHAAHDCWVQTAPAHELVDDRHSGPDGPLLLGHRSFGPRTQSMLNTLSHVVVPHARHVRSSRRRDLGHQAGAGGHEETLA
jgi:hypothetical protein